MRKNIRWIIVLLLFLVRMINYLDRVVSSIMVPMIEKDLVLNAEQLDMIFGSFFLGYTIFNFIGGLAVDKFDATSVMGLAVGSWSLFCGLTTATIGFYSMLVPHVLFGMAEGPICVSAGKMINGWFPERQAATAAGFLSANSPLGGAVAGPIVDYLALAFGWRPAFMITFAVGIVWMVVRFFIVANSSDKHKHASQEELMFVNKVKQEEDALETVEDQTAHSLGYYLEQPTILVTAFAFSCYNYILFFFLSWFPSYLVQQHHLNIKQMSLTTIIPWIVGFVDLALGSYVSDKIFNLTGRLLLSRKTVPVVRPLMAALCVGLVGTISSAVPAVLLMSVSVFLLHVTRAIYWAITQDMVHKSRVSGASGSIRLIGSASGIVGPVVMGYIVQSTDKFGNAFTLAGAIAALSAMLVLLMIRTSRMTMRASQA